MSRPETRITQAKRRLPFVLAVILLLAPVFAATGLSGVARSEPASPEKTVKGFRGEAKLIARQWLRHEKKITALEFMPGEKGRFWNMGSLVGTLSDGRKVSIDLENDFSGRSPGLLRGHLDALKFKAETSALSPQEYKALLDKKIRLHQKLATEQQVLEKEIRQEIELRLEDDLEKQLSTSEKLVVKKTKNAFMPEIRKRVREEVENEVKQAFPNASPEQLNLEIAAKLARQSHQRINRALRKKIMAANLVDKNGAPEVNTFTEKNITFSRARIAAEVRAEYAGKRSRELSRRKDLARGGDAMPEEKQASFLEKLKKLLSWDWAEALMNGTPRQ